MPKKKRRKSGRGKKFLRWGGIVTGAFRLVFRIFPLAAAAALAGGLFVTVRQALYADSALAVSRIVVEPSEALPAIERRALETKFLGKNILRVNLRAVSRELEKDPQIRRAAVVRRLPAELRVFLELRKPVALIQFSPKGSFGLVSEDGMILDTLLRPNASMFLIEAYAAGIKEPQSGAVVPGRGYTEAIRFMKAFWDHPLSRREAISKISLDHLGNVTAVLGNGPAVRLGRRPAERMKALEKVVLLLQGENRAGIDYVDLQFDNIIVKRKK